MIYFITKRTDHNSFIYKSQKITVVDNYGPIVNFLLQKLLAVDSEFNGKRLHMIEPLLLQYGDKDNQLVFDCTKGQHKEHISFLNKTIVPETVLFGHNLKADMNVFIPLGLRFPFIWDGMVAEQRIMLGSGESVAYNNTFERRLKRFFPEDKAIRGDFLYMHNQDAIMEPKHITYSAQDVDGPIDIAKEQRKILERTGQFDFVRLVENSLVKVLSEAELEGINLDEVKWKSILELKKKKRFEFEKLMDSEIVRLGAGNMYIMGGKFTNDRRKATVVQSDLFGGKPLEIENKNIHNLNYNSSPAIIDAIERLGYPVPTFKQKFGRDETDSMREEAIQAYIIDNPQTPLRKFLESLVEYKGLQKFISSYGEKFLSEYVPKGSSYDLGYKNPITKRVHTVFKQCFTDTGRLSSGSKAEGLFNSQQIPADKEIREAFTLTQQEILDDWWITTVDLTGAEAVIMAAFSDDLELYDLAVIKDDIHSPIATMCWQGVAKMRVENKRDMTIKDTKGKVYTLAPDMLIVKDKKHPLIQLRTDFKSYTFGTIYGMKAKKGGETLNIPKDESQIMINLIKKRFHKTVSMTDRAVQEAYLNGYVVSNCISNNRRNFKEIQELLSKIDKSKFPPMAIINYVKDNLPFDIQAEVEGAARNYRIQGTQADMIKEAMVKIALNIRQNNLQAKIILSVHDEIVVKHKGKAFGDVQKQIMIDTANRYLEPYSKTIKMKADGHTGHSWTK